MYPVVPKGRPRELWRVPENVESAAVNQFGNESLIRVIYISAEHNVVWFDAAMEHDGAGLAAVHVDKSTHDAMRHGHSSGPIERASLFVIVQQRRESEPA
jgi:hypothetical protein